MRRVAVVLNPNISANVAFLHTAGTAAASWGVKVTAVGVRSTAEIEPLVTAFAREPDGGMIVTPSPLTNTTENRALLFALAAQLGLPAIYPYRLVAGSSGLISYSYAALRSGKAARLTWTAFCAAQNRLTFPCRPRPSTT